MLCGEPSRAPETAASAAGWLAFTVRIGEAWSRWTPSGASTERGPRGSTDGDATKAPPVAWSAVSPGPWSRDLNGGAASAVCGLGTTTVMGAGGVLDVVVKVAAAISGVAGSEPVALVILGKGASQSDRGDAAGNSRDDARGGVCAVA